MNKPAIILLSFALLFINAAQGQNPSIMGNLPNAQNYSASYIIPSDTEIRMAVNIWGEVAAPGQYLIPYSINLDIISLLSQAGGPTRNAKLSKVILLREVEDQLDPKRIIIDIDEYLETGDKSKLPNLEPNDTIIIDPTFMATLKSQTAWVDILYKFATVYILIDRFK